jgi:hypothetical protein
MCYTGLIKRIIPFVLTFAAGLFIASFFVSIAVPGERWRSNRRAHRFQEMRQLRIENDELRERLRVMRMEIEELRLTKEDINEFVIPEVLPPASFEAHHPPRKPKKPRVIE